MCVYVVVLMRFKLPSDFEGAQPAPIPTPAQPSSSKPREELHQFLVVVEASVLRWHTEFTLQFLL